MDKGQTSQKEILANSKVFIGEEKQKDEEKYKKDKLNLNSGRP